MRFRALPGFLKNTRRLDRLLAVLVCTIVFSLNSFGQISIGTGKPLVNPPTGGFEIDGNLQASASGGDWLGTTAGTFVINSNSFGSPVNTAITFHSTDLFGSGDNIFNGGLKKNDNPNLMGWKTGSPSPAKCDINHFMLHISKTSDGHTWITIAGDRQSVTGNSFISLALHQNSLTLGSGTFVSAASNSTGGRTPGDVQVSAEFTGGGSNPNLYLEEWKLVGSSYIWAPITIPIGKVVAFGKTNGSIITGMPYQVFGGTSYPVNSFIEVSFDITEIYDNTTTPCVGSIKSILALTKSSQAVNADLTDFVAPIQVNLNINAAPPAANGANYCVGQSISNLAVTNPDAGAVYKWYTTVDGNGKPTGTPSTGTTYSPSVSNATAGTHNFYVTQSVDGCESSPTTVTINVVANPVKYALSGNSICTGTGTLTLANSESGVTYQLKRADNHANEQTAQTGDGTSLEWTGITAGVGYYVQAKRSTPTECTTNSDPASVTAGQSPTVFTLSGNSICASATNTGVLTLSSSQSGVSYQLKNASTNGNVQDAQAGDGTSLEWTGLAAGVNYYVQATATAPPNCTSVTANASVTEVANPSIYTLSANSICAENPNTGVVTLSNSQTGVSYQLKKATDDSDVQTAQAGDGTSLEWTDLAAGIAYYVQATGAAPTNCQSVTTNATVTQVANPAVYMLSGNSICSADENTGVITLSNSQSGVTYQLKKTSDHTNVQPAQAGATGTQLTWINLPSGVNFYVLATGAAPTNCTSTTGNASITISENPSKPALTVVNPTCSTATGTVTVASPVGTAYEYSFNDGDFTSSTGPFEFEAGQGYKVEVRNTTSGCISTPEECSGQTITIASPSLLDANVKATIPGGKTKVLAAPNPFTDRVKFTMESAVSGMGSLEIYNTLGQRIGVVFRGFVEAGKPQVKEFSVPSVQRSMLVYVFRVGNERVTGKLISNR